MTLACGRRRSPAARVRDGRWRAKPGRIKNSGYGRELSYLGIREFVNAKTVWVDQSETSDDSAASE